MKKIAKLLLFISIFLIFIFPNVSFAEVSLVAQNIANKQVTLKATGLTPSTTVYLSVLNDVASPTTPEYSMTINQNSGFSGLASSTFYSLSPGSDYIGRVSYSSNPDIGALKTINFKTTGTPLSSENSILTFSININSQSLAGDIFKNNDIFIETPLGTDVTALSPILTISPKASVSPASGVSQNFTNPVTYQVTAENGSKKTYRAFVTRNNPTLAISFVGVAEDSVAIEATNFPPNKNITFYVNNFDSRTPLYEESQLKTTNGGGEARVIFSGLFPDGHYMYKTSEDLTKYGSFWARKVCQDGWTGTYPNCVAPSNEGGNATATSGDFDKGEPSNLIPCGTERYTEGDNIGQVKNPCHFADFLTMINNVINFIFFKLVIPIAAILFAYAGFMMVTSGGDTERRGKALKVFKDVGLGLVFIAASWLIVSTILSIVGFDGAWIGF